eukprot:g7001.t1
MNFGDETERFFGELFGSHAEKEARIISPNRPQPSATKFQDESSNQSDSDDDFALPSAKPSTPATERSTSPSETMVDGGSGSSEARGGAGATAAGAPAKTRSEDDETEDETVDESADETVETVDKTTAEERKFDQTKFDDFPDPTNQRETYWDIITPEQLVWYQGFPALVVPERLHFSTEVGPQDGVMAYGPSAKNVQPSKKRYVVIQYFPLCLTCHQKPLAPYERVGGQRVERVIPYNTIMAKKASEGRELGAEDKWADTDHHYNEVKAKWKSLTERNWKVAMDNVHKFLARALERKAELAAQAAEDNRLAEEELERQRQEREAQEEEEEEEEEEAGSDKEGAEAGAGARSAEDDDDDPAEPQSQTVEYRTGLPLAPGDRIVYWDRTKRTGAADARMEATVLEIRTKKAAKQENLCLLVLDNNQIVMDDWVVQRFVKDEKTGEVTVAREACMVKDHKLKKGKLKGRDPLKNERFDKMKSEFKEDIKAFGAGDQLRCSGGGGAETESSDDESTGSTEQPSKTTVKGKAKAKGSRAKKEGRAGGVTGRAGSGSSGGCGAGGSGGSRGRIGGGSVSSGRSATPLTEDDVGDEVNASISRTKTAAKPKQQGGDSGRPVKKAKTITKAEDKGKGKGKGAKKQGASAGKGGGRGAQKEQEVEPEKSKSKSQKEGKRKGSAAAGASKKRSAGDDDCGEGGSKNNPVDMTSGGGGGVAGKPKATKKRSKPFSSSLVSPPSDAAEHQGPKKNKAKKAEQQSKPYAAEQRGPQKKAEQEGPPNKKAERKKPHQGESDAAVQQLGSRKRGGKAKEERHGDPEAAGEQQGPPEKKEKKDGEEEQQQSKPDSMEEGKDPSNTKPVKEGQRQRNSNSPVLPGGGGAGRAGGGGGGKNDPERKSATMTPDPIASKVPIAAGGEKLSPPSKSAAAGASDGPPQAAAETDWRERKKRESS